MTDLLNATDTSSHAGLVKALERAAAAGRTSTAETLLGAVADRYPRGSTDEAVRALNRAVHNRQWTTAAYFADFLADTARPRGARGGGSLPASEHIDQEVLRCLADRRREHCETAGPDEPFLLTDAIQDTTCIEPTDRLECRHHAGTHAGKKMGGGGKKKMGEGDAIAFEHVDPDLPSETYCGENNPCMHFSLAAPDRSAATLRGKAERVAPPGGLSLRITFPPEVSGTYEVVTSGSRESLARAVAAKYGELLEPGVSGYDLADLDLERVVPGDDGYAAEVMVA